ncbi:hypothetical protein ACFX15_031002 [Malus domestica]
MSTRTLLRTLLHDQPLEFTRTRPWDLPSFRAGSSAYFSEIMWLLINGCLVLPGLGGPEAVVLLVEMEDQARRGVAGGFGEANVGFGGRTWCDAGVGGFEKEEDEGDGADEDGDVGEPLQEYLDVPLHNGGDRKQALYRWRV